MKAPATAGTPSVKGILVMSTVAMIKDLVAKGGAAKAALDEELGPEARSLLSEPLSPTAWYSAETHRELHEFHFRVEGNNDPDWGRQRGERLAAMISATDRYSQLKDRNSELATDPDARLWQIKHEVSVQLSLIPQLFNFLNVTVDIVPGSPTIVHITYENAALLSELNRFSTEGFLNYMTRKRGRWQPRWRSRRVSKDKIRFTLPIDDPVA